MNVSTDSLMRAFARGDRVLAVPATMAIRRDSGEGDLGVAAVLRLLPRKRLVVRAQLDGRTVAVKWFAADQGGHRHIERERAGAAAVAGAAVRSPRILETVATPDGAFLGLVYEWIDAPELARLWPTLTPPQRRVWLQTVLDVLARLHAAGVRQMDIHLGNFLVAGADLWLLDLGTVVQWSGPLDRRASLRNLAAFAAQLAADDRAQLSALLPGYLRQRGWADTAAAAKCYGSALAAAWAARVADYLDKAFRDCSLTSFTQTFRAVSAVRRSVLEPELARVCAEPESAMTSPVVLKAGNTATVVQAEIDGVARVVKRYNIKHWRHALSRCWRPTRAAHSWRCAHLLEIAGIRSPQPVALIEQRWGWLRGRAYFICAAVAGENLLALGERGALSPAVLASLRELLLGLRRERISHGDFKATNFLVSGDAVTLIDLDAMRRHRSDLTFRTAFVRDLKRLQRNWPDASPVRVQIDALVAELRPAA